MLSKLLMTEASPADILMRLSCLWLLVRGAGGWSFDRRIWLSNQA